MVRDGRSGVLVDRADPPSLAGAVRKLEARPADPAECRASAERFGVEPFFEGFERVLAAT